MMSRLSILGLWLLFAGAACADTPSYEADVLPLLQQHCYKCHGGEKVKGGLRLNNREAVLRGGDLGPAFIKEKPDDSPILKAINYRDGLEMPPTGKLPQKDIDTLTRWLKADLPGLPGGAKPAEASHGKAIIPAKDYWAYQPLKRPAVPAVKDQSWVRTPIDAFILAKLEANGLKPNPPAEPGHLIRRLNYDLLGLPPTPEEIDAFVAASKENRNATIERLLASPHYGEKWGRHWLDVVRYAETNGYERDGAKPFVWKYRDYVIKSFNADKPYDRFIVEQIAGDELPDANAETITATGYHRLGVWDDEPADPKQALFDGYDDLVATTGQAFLAMTLNCCRCHDHKGDPIPQTDYYRMAAFFRDIRPFSDTRDTSSKFNLTDVSPPEKRKLYETELAARQARMDELKEKMRPIEDEAIKQMPPEMQLKVQDGHREEVVRQVGKYLAAERKGEYQRLRRELDEQRRRPMPARDLALSVNNCDAHPPAMKVLIRGNPHAEGVEVKPGFPSVIGGGDAVFTPRDRHNGRRTELAKWLASDKNPLTARVMVNRIWHFHFGRGLVPSCNDFGQLGEKPTHPELLDWLASEFMANGWSVKKLHRLILSSNTYQMSSRGRAEALAKDPGNHFWWRYPMRRLEAEEVRDSILAVTASLNRALYGPSVYPPIPKDVLAGQSVPGQGWHTSSPPDANRRSVYVHVKRSLQVPILATHDQADTDSSCPVRYTTTVPTQALGMLNGAFLQEQAKALADRLEQETPGDRPAQVRRAIRLTTGRVPDAAEVAKDLAFMAELEAKEKLDAASALRHYCLLALNANEFVYVD